jgi:hypothetical protein
MRYPQIRLFFLAEVFVFLDSDGYRSRGIFIERRRLRTEEDEYYDDAEQEDQYSDSI